MAVYTKQESDGYTKVGTGAFQIQSRKPGTILGTINSSDTPADTDPPELLFTSPTGPEITHGADDCYVKVFSVTPVMFGAVAV